MIDELLKNPVVTRYLPFAAGLLFVVAFVSLGRWQLERAAEKEALQALFDDDARYAQPADIDALQEFDRVEFFGQYRPERQLLIDNIPLEGRFGYYVITPFKPSTDDGLLLVNRGWIAKTGLAGDPPALDVGTDFRTLRGLVGRLPRVAIRSGEAFDQAGGWPRVAMYPTLDEVAAALGEPLLPVVLLLSPDAADGFTRRWEPDISGPMTHYSYAAQWFALAAAVVGLLGWHARKRWRRDPGPA